MNNRIEHIDVARGIAILLVVLGHCFHSAEAPLNRFILSFHMPLFFFLSGVFAKQVKLKGLLGGAFSKVKSLLIPQLTLSVTIIVLKGGLWISEGKCLADFDFISCFGFWFLPVLFICSVVYMVVSVLLKFEKKVNRVAVVLLLLMLAIFTVYSHFSSEYVIVDWLIKSSVAMFFYFCGSFLKDKVLRIDDCKCGYRGLWLLVSCCVLIILAQMNEPVKMYQNDYGFFPLFLLSSFIGIWLVIEISKRFVNTVFLNEMGRLSIAVYVWNFLIVGVSIRVMNLFMKGIDIINDGILTAATFIVSIVVLYFVSKLTYIKLPFLYGKMYS